MLDLGKMRDEIDVIDSEIVRLFEKRMKICENVAQFKIETGKPVFDKSREQDKLKTLGAKAGSDFNRCGVEELFQQIMSISRKRQYQLLQENGIEEPSDFTKIDFIFEHSVASVKVGDGVKSEGELIISGTNGYIYVPAPWWKTDYFEIRYENPKENKRYFYQLDGEGIRYELVDFLRSIERGKSLPNINFSTTKAISTIMEDFFLRNDYISI